MRGDGWVNVSGKCVSMENNPASPEPPAPPEPKLEFYRALLMRGFIVLLALVLGGYGILVVVKLILKARW
jgi:hypothetical protein